MKNLKNHLVPLLMTLTLCVFAWQQDKLQKRVDSLESKVDMHHEVLIGVVETLTEMEPVIETVKSFFEAIMGINKEPGNKAQ